VTGSRWVRSAGRPISQVAQVLRLSHEPLRNWVKEDRVDRGQGGPGELTSDQLEELRSLRRQVKELQAEREVLRRAAAYFQRLGMLARRAEPGFASPPVRDAKHPARQQAPRQPPWTGLRTHEHASP
jgi:transposase